MLFLGLRSKPIPSYLPLYRGCFQLSFLVSLSDSSDLSVYLPALSAERTLEELAELETLGQILGAYRGDLLASFPASVRRDSSALRLL